MRPIHPAFAGWGRGQPASAVSPSRPECPAGGSEAAPPVRAAARRSRTNQTLSRPLPDPAQFANKRQQTATRSRSACKQAVADRNPIPPRLQTGGGRLQPYSALLANERQQTAEEVAVRREPNREGVRGKLPPTAASRVCCFFLCAPSQKRGHTKNTNALLSRPPHTPEARTATRAKGAGLPKSCRGGAGGRGAPMRGGSRKSRTRQAAEPHQAGAEKSGQPQAPTAP